ncbi:hypothetical protein PPL_04404 [Heterostelium album PN500]|uniref:Uncharacterized protein n=1 Tax=Heterostelium pallidum (strain ATCC 26659 / Pp 5 / PN500) TaxID=670386 RepID=D3B7G6_HETP5|nr:hypothetical protein PPL_04404 [Heterostelium album PN500]EFA82709.1 hypothetical protein PPL_04404 [Heterostelium album PN500]|eukprot:XP_020434826.1 hypothetical protein PPL_04404 [Heterostelium album PN500]
MKENWFISIVKNHFRGGSFQRSENTIEREKILIFNIPFNRWILFPCAFLIHLCIGSLQGWSILNKPIDKHIYGDPTKGRAPITNYIAMTFDCLTLLIVSPWLERNDIKIGLLIGGFFYGLAQFCTAVGLYTKQIVVVYLGYGVFGGIGHAILFLIPICALQKWFPDHRGLASGLSVCGTTSGTIIFSLTTLPLFDRIGIVNSFLTFGSLYIGISFGLSWIFRLPPPEYKASLSLGIEMNQLPIDNSQQKEVAEPTPNRMTLYESLLSSSFFFILITFVLNGLTGNTINSRLTNLIQDIFNQTSKVGSIFLSICATCNVFGRVIYGVTSGKIGGKSTFIIIQSFTISTLIGMVAAIQYNNLPVFCTISFLYAVNFGGSQGIVAGYLTEKFGIENLNTLLAIVSAAWSISGVLCGFIFTAVYDSLKKSHPFNDPILYSYNIYWLFSLAFVGWILCFFTPDTRDRNYPAAPNQIFQTRLFGRVFRLIKRRGNPFELLSKTKEKEEWYNFLLKNNK